jgi:hypothetical protein
VLTRTAIAIGALLAACNSDRAPAPGASVGSALDHLIDDHLSAVAYDPAIATLFASGAKCTWGDGDIATCPEPELIRKLAQDRKSDRGLAASCATALRDRAMTTRRLAAECLGGVSDATLGPLLAAGLDAFETEGDPKTRDAIARAFSSANASAVGLEPRVIALVRNHAGSDEFYDNDAASNLLGALFPIRVMPSPKASKAAGDLALELVRTGRGNTRFRAIENIADLTDRMSEVCAALGAALASEEWVITVTTLTKFPRGCPAEREPAADVIGIQMRKGNYNLAMEEFVKRLPLTPAQAAKLAADSKVLVDLVPGWERADAKRLAALLEHYKPPT